MTTATGSAPALTPGSCNAHCHVYSPAARLSWAPDARFVPAVPTRRALAAQLAPHCMQKHAQLIVAKRINAE
ncbi:MAG TPA: hypothetical protein VFL86_29445 [Burkholderiaceae bacterium]|nr:hypothetical protein [Burkholderiaceae bacterium]